MTTIDCRNLACPAPVITVKKALEEQAEFRVLLDDGAPRENVTRFARNRGCQVCEERDGNGWALTISTAERTPQPAAGTATGERVVLITSNRLGDGPEELGSLLMKNFIHTLLETSDLPTRMLFLNTGVFLTVEGSDVLEALEKLGGMGVEILSCGLCLDFFKLKDKLKAGTTTNMLTTVESLLSAPQVIRL
ncbi:sulfurtransferase-like selenium metabolism protein YedF [Geobacter sp. AOG2]|uniref:sulfurtransferase-like selenium metabolism protein YedF n=1 Tax=Geobacter sp. AOG2 TaxID=1566347 RepID=UPI001CC7C63F|nr:sulfurtransferase-like selenium metabolism protein YedF [Geobacter sp. AOG2]GFE60406.1 selenium metabolism protein YedF [Geobacter sp. AOG2]